MAMTVLFLLTCLQLPENWWLWLTWVWFNSTIVKFSHTQTLSPWCSKWSFCRPICWLHQGAQCKVLSRMIYIVSHWGESERTDRFVQCIVNLSYLNTPTDTVCFTQISFRSSQFQCGGYASYNHSDHKPSLRQSHFSVMETQLAYNSRMDISLFEIHSVRSLVKGEV